MGFFDVFDKVRTVLAESFGIDEENIKAETTIVMDLGAQRLDLMDITFRLKKEFNIEIAQEQLFPEDRIYQVTLESIADYIDRRINYR